MRITLTVSACCAGAKPGAMTTRTSHGASEAGQHRQAADDEDDQLVIGAGQPPGARAVAGGERNRRSTGMKAVASAPPATIGEQQIGQLEGGVVGVQVGADAERRAMIMLRSRPGRGRQRERRRRPADRCGRYGAGGRSSLVMGASARPAPRWQLGVVGVELERPLPATPVAAAMSPLAC